MIKIVDFGKLDDGKKISKIIIENKNGTKASFISYGAIWAEMFVKDKTGKLRDVVQGFDDLEGYLHNEPHLGAPIGRYANRIGNAKFILEGKEYKLYPNKDPHSLHSGPDFWDKRVWDFEVVENKVIFKLLSKDMDQGFPANLKVEIAYSLDDNDALHIDYTLLSDDITVANITNHAYFNLDGTDSTSILNHILRFNADTFNYLNEDAVATGLIRKVEKTPLDFRKPKKIGLEIEEDYDSLKIGAGYDQNFILNNDIKETYSGLKEACDIYSEDSGIRMRTYTDLEGVQFYTANSLSIDYPGKNGHFYEKRSSFCLETGHLPNALNIPEFPSPIIKKNEVYKTSTIYKFSIWEN